MTRDERLQAMAARAQADLDSKKRDLARIEAEQRARARRTTNRRRYQVGAWMEEAGLLALDDATLSKLIAAMAPLASLPNPVAVLDVLIVDALEHDDAV